MADEAVNFLIENLMQSMREQGDLLLEIKGEIDDLLRSLWDFNSFLKEEAYKMKRKDSKELVKRVRPVVNAAEDAICKFVIGSKIHADLGIMKFVHIAYYQSMRDAVYEIRRISEKVKEIRKTEVYGLQALQYEDPSSRYTEERKSPVVEEDDVVGFDEEVRKISDRLCGGSDSLEVIPVVGMPGLGKTTLATQVYNHPRVEYEFFTRIWVYVSQSYRRRELFLNIISRFTRSTKQYHDMFEEDLAHVIRDFLGKGGRYLFVLDDVWSEEAWERIKIALPNNNKRNRVLLTTRDSKVAKHLSEMPHYLKFLTENESWILLENKVFHKNKCPSELEKTGKSIAAKCGGLPIAILLIAGALIGKYKTTREWELVNQNVFIIVNSMNKKLVQMSYDHLPYDLKACFLYCGVFPRGFEIPSWKLIRLWIAEGFIQDKGQLPLEFQAEDYLNDLVNRNLVMVMKMTFDGKIKTCRVHDTLHEFCRQEAMVENLFQEVKVGVEQYFPGKRELSTHHRLCIHSSVLEFISTRPFGEYVKSFLSFSSKKIEMPTADIPAIPKGFPLLRVLDVESIKFNPFCKEFFQLYHLRYIAISSDMLRVLPRRTAKFWNLQTLIINTKQLNVDIKADIWSLSRLRHLHTNASATLPMPVSPKRNKVTLVNKSLQTLSTISPESCTGEVFARAPNLKKLGIRGKIALLLGANNAGRFNSVAQLEHLERLKLINDDCQIGTKVCLPPAHIFPAELRKLTLLNTLLEWDDMSVLGQLVNLEVLKLKKNACKGDYWEPEVGGFRSLLVLLIERTDLASWNASADHFPRLKNIVIMSCYNLEEIPIALADIHSLQLIKLDDSKKAAKSAREIQAKKEKQTQEGTKNIVFELSIFPPDL